MKIAIVTDAWRPQVNGVVRTLASVMDYLEQAGHEVLLISPQQFRTVPTPSYPEIPLSLFPRRKVFRMLDAFAPDAIHLATEGPLGWAARAWCLARGRAFTSSYHTQFPEYIALRLPIPLRWSYATVRRFHAPAVRTLVPTERMRDRLEKNGFEHVEVWGHGVDLAVFSPSASSTLDHLPRPISICTGRVAVEKNLDAFLDLPLAGSRVVVGSGPDLPRLKRKFPDVHFTDYLPDTEMVAHLRAADVFVFPSRTETFGLVMLEAMACGLPVAAYPVVGPLDVVRDGETGELDENLLAATLRALRLDRSAGPAYAEQHSWKRYAMEFEALLVDSSTARFSVRSRV